MCFVSLLYFVGDYFPISQDYPTQTLTPTYSNTPSLYAEPISPIFQPTLPHIPPNSNPSSQILKLALTICRPTLPTSVTHSPHVSTHFLPYYNPSSPYSDTLSLILPAKISLHGATFLERQYEEYLKISSVGQCYFDQLIKQEVTINIILNSENIKILHFFKTQLDI